MQWLQDKHKKLDVILGIEPTGHYWFDLGAYLEDEGILLVMVNPYAVKHTKELDDNSQSKNDCKDPKVIAKLVIEGRYSAPYTPDGVYADLRVLTNNRRRIIRELTQIKIVFQGGLRYIFLNTQMYLRIMKKKGDSIYDS